MARISDFRIYAERKYQESGEWKSEEIELGQLVPQRVTLPIPEDIFFYPYDENKLGTRRLSFIQNSRYAGYKPGKIFFPPKKFTFFDLFTSEELSIWMTNMLDNFAEDISQETFFYKFANDIFWQLPCGMNIIPVLRCRMSKASYSINNDTIEHIKREVQYDLAFIGTYLEPDVLSWKNNKYYYTEDGEEKQLSDFIGFSGIWSTFCLGAPILSKERTGIRYANFQEHQDGLNYFVQNLVKLKFYPFWNHYLQISKIDNVEYVTNIYQYVIPETVEQTKTSGTYADMLCIVPDFSDCLNTPADGFAVYHVDRFNNNAKCGGVTRIDWSGGPESNNPGETDDPNDDDPGHGNGDDPDDKGGDGDHDNTSDIIEPPGIPPISATGVGLVSVYNPTSSQLAALGAKLWNPTALDAIKQYFTNPMDTILGLSIVPVSPRTGVSKNIHLGVYDTEVSASLVDSDYVIINCGSIPINRYYGSYLDYDPYTKITCYLPYIGEIEVNPDQVMQKSLEVLYYVNVITGDIVAILCADGSIIYTVAGNCIRQLPMSQSDYSAIINTAVSAVTTIATAAVGASAAGAVGGAVAGAAKTSAGAAVAEARTSAEISNQVMGAGNSLINQVMSSKMRYNHAGSIGTGSGQLTYQTPYLTIERPNLDLADSYKSFVGYPCNKTMQLSRCTGFTQIEATKLSIPGATDEEITEILQFLVEGVII